MCMNVFMCDSWSQFTQLFHSDVNLKCMYLKQTFHFNFNEVPHPVFYFKQRKSPEVELVQKLHFLPPDILCFI